MRRLTHLLLSAAICLLAFEAWGDDLDKKFEEGTGLDKALASKPPTINADPNVEGKKLPITCNEICKVEFTFDKGKTGTFPYDPTDDTQKLKGVYLKISATAEKCGECEKLRFIQIARGYKKDGTGNAASTDPGEEKRRKRAGWGDASSPSRGWFVDRQPESKEAYYGGDDKAAEGASEDGGAGKPARLRDCPGKWETAKSAGKEFYSCLVCTKKGAKGKVLACVHWGFYIDGTGTIAFEPKTPEVSCGPPQQMKDALARWDGNSPNVE